MLKQARHEAKNKKFLFVLVPLFLIVAVGAIGLYVFVIKPQSNETGAASDATSATTSDTKGISMKNLEKTDNAFNDEHYVSSGESGFTSPYGYYYFDRRELPSDSTITKKWFALL